MNQGLRIVLSVAGLAGFTILAVGSMESEEKTQKAVTSQDPVATLTAKELFKAYEDNEVSADAKYKDKIVQVSGVIEDIGKDLTDSIYVILRVDPHGIGGIQCFFSDSDAGRVANFRKGQHLTVKGKCSGKMMNVLIRGCVIL